MPASTQPLMVILFPLTCSNPAWDRMRFRIRPVGACAVYLCLRPSLEEPRIVAQVSTPNWAICSRAFPSPAPIHPSFMRRSSWKGRQRTTQISLRPSPASGMNKFSFLGPWTDG